MADELLTTAEAAKRLRVSPATLFRWRKAGAGPDFVMIGRRLFYTPAMLADWLASQRRTPKAGEMKEDPAPKQETTP